MIHAEVTLPTGWQNMTLDDVLAALEPTDEELAAIEAAEAEAERLWFAGIDELYQRERDEAEWWALGEDGRSAFAATTMDCPPF